MSWSAKGHSTSFDSKFGILFFNHCALKIAHSVKKMLSPDHFCFIFQRGFGGYCFPFLNIKNKGSKSTWYFQCWWMRSFLFRPCLEKSWSLNRGSSGGSTVKNPPAMQVGKILHIHPIPGSEGSLGEGNGNPLQYSCLGNAMDIGAWWATVDGVARESYTTYKLINNNRVGGSTWEVYYLLSTKPMLDPVGKWCMVKSVPSINHLLRLFGSCHRG